MKELTEVERLIRNRPIFGEFKDIQAYKVAISLWAKKLEVAWNNYKQKLQEIINEKDSEEDTMDGLEKSLKLMGRKKLARELLVGLEPQKEEKPK